MKVYFALATAVLFVGCASVQPQDMRKFWIGGNEETFTKDYAECRMKADERGPGAGTMAMNILLWPVGLAMTAQTAIDSHNTMNLCMASKGWSPVKKP